MENPDEKLIKELIERHKVFPDKLKQMTVLWHKK
jgi:hypothetical protein